MIRGVLNRGEREGKGREEREERRERIGRKGERGEEGKNALLRKKRMGK
jgi:hypothetical protein